MIFLSLLIFILAMSLPFFKTQITPIFFTRIAALAFIYAGALNLNALHIQSIGSGIGIYSGFFQITYFSLFIETFLYVVGAIILLSWALVKTDVNTLNFRDWISEEITSPSSTTSISIVPESKEYSLIALFSALGGSFLLSSGDLLSMYLSIELQSFGLYILATIFRDSSSATGAGLKYFLLGGLSSCLILLGASLIYSFTGLTSFESIYSLVSVISMNHYPFTNLELGDNLLPQTITAAEPFTFGDLGSLTGNVSQGLSLGLILIVVGFLFKIAGAPFHNWSPDVYDESPTNITIWLTIMPKISIVIFLLELEMGIASQVAQPFVFSSISDLSQSTGYLTSLSLNSISPLSLSLPLSLTGGVEGTGGSEGTGYSFALLSSIGLGGGAYVLKNIFLLSSLLSLIIGTVVGLAQIRIKRLLAYSTISHVGFLLLALAINTEQSTESLILYLIQYIITSLNTFFILLAFGYIINSSISSTYVNSDLRFIFDLKGQFISNPILSISLAICLFSMAGIPPLMGFFGKQSVLYAAIGNGYFFMALLAIIVSVISAYYYLRIIKELHSESEVESEADNANSSIPLFQIESSPSVPLTRKNDKEDIQSSLILTNIHSFIIATLTLSILFFVLKPSIILNSTVLLSLSLFNG